MVLKREPKRELLGTGDETEEETVPTETDGKQMRRGRTTRS